MALCDEETVLRNFSEPTALKEAERGSRGKSLLYLIQIQFALDPARSATSKPLARRSFYTKAARRRRERNRRRKLSKNFPVRLGESPREAFCQNADGLSGKILLRGRKYLGGPLMINELLATPRLGIRSC